MALYDADGAEVPLKWPPPSPPVHLPGGGAVNLTATATLADGAQLWSVARPYLYTVAVTIVAGAAAYGKEDGAPGLVTDVTGAGVDAFNLTVGLGQSQVLLAESVVFHQWVLVERCLRPC